MQARRATGHLLNFEGMKRRLDLIAETADSGLPIGSLVGAILGIVGGFVWGGPVGIIGGVIGGTLAGGTLGQLIGGLVGTMRPSGDADGAQPSDE